MRALLAFLVYTGAAISQSVEPTKASIKPPDALIAAYFKADAAVGAVRAQHDALMEKQKKEIADSVSRQVNAWVNAVIARSQLEAACGEFQLDQEALKASEVKCVAKEKK